ncbi:MAG TPA: PilN domain-containing protein [Vicinamibacterales bacterium]|nr:PilN domain-containing protein [Vicinamibacterales bacterium]
MIRINLLAVERGAAKRAALIPAAQRVTIGASLILLAAAMMIGWWYWSLSQASHRVDEELARAEAETQQLRSVLAQVQKFETQRAQLQQRVTLIEQLRRGQTAPVHVLDEIGRAVPERLWLTEFKQTGDNLTIVGLTTSLTGVSDFVGNLESSSWFKRPVDIIDTEMSQDVKTGDLVRFSVKATINNPDAPALPATPKPGAAPGTR